MTSRSPLPRNSLRVSKAEQLTAQPLAWTIQTWPMERQLPSKVPARANLTICRRRSTPISQTISRSTIRKSKVAKGGRVRLRIINGATATAFTIDLGGLDGMLTAVDGQDIAPVKGRRFPIAMGQRLDIRFELPRSNEPFPILALREGVTERTGIVLAPRNAPVKKLASAGQAPGPVIDLVLEQTLRAARPLTSRQPDKRFDMALLGTMQGYAWSLQAKPTIVVRKNDRIEVTMLNSSMMAHPMRLHGHHFQVVAIDRRRLSGAMRDTIHIPPHRSVTIAFDATNAGEWAFHCHHLYHMAAGMMTTVKYEA